MGIERCETLVDVLTSRIHIFSVLELTVLIDSLFYEYLFKRSEVQALHQFSPTDFQFALEQLFGVVHGASEHVAHCQETRFVVVDNTAVGRDAHFAIRESIEGIDSLVGRSSGSEVNGYLHLGGSDVVHSADFYLAFFVGLEDAFDERRDGFAKRNLGDDKRLAVALFDFRTHLHRSAAHTVVVARHVDGAAGLEVGIQVKLFAVQVLDGGIAYLAEVVRQYLCRQAHGNSLCALRQQQWELHGQRNRLFVSSVVGQFPLRCFGIKQHIEGKFRESGFDVSRCSGAVAGQYVTPVALAVDEQVLLPELHKRVADGCISVGVKLHRVSHDVGHLVIASVIETLHRVQDAALHGFETVAQVRHGAFQNNIGGIIQKPVAIHPGELVCRVVVFLFLRCVGRMRFLQFDVLFAHVSISCKGVKGFHGA